MSDQGPRRFRIADYAVPPGALPPRWPIRRVLRAVVDVGCGLYGAGVLGLWGAVNWSPPEFWPSHLFLYGPRCYNVPHIPVLPSMRDYPHIHMASKELTADFLRTQDCLVIVTDHTAYDWAWIVKHALLLIDTRNATENISSFTNKIVLA